MGFLLSIIVPFVIFFIEDSLWAITPKISAGGYHSIALKSDGTLWAWGRNGYGQLGDGSTVDKHYPVQVGDNNWASIAAGGA